MVMKRNYTFRGNYYIMYTEVELLCCIFETYIALYTNFSSIKRITFIKYWVFFFLYFSREGTRYDLKNIKIKKIFTFDSVICSLKFSV